MYDVVTEVSPGMNGKHLLEPVFELVNHEPWLRSEYRVVESGSIPRDG